MNRAPLFALRTLWANGGAAQAFVAHDHRMADALERLAGDRVPDFVRRDGAAFRTLAATVDFDRLLSGDAAENDIGARSDSDADVLTRDVSRERVGRGDDAGARAGSMRAAGIAAKQTTTSASGDGLDERSPYDAKTASWSTGREVSHPPRRRDAYGERVDIADDVRLRRRSRGVPDIPSETGDVEGERESARDVASSPERSIPSRTVARSDTAGGRGPATPLSGVDRRTPSNWRVVAPLASTLSADERRGVEAILARHDDRVASSREGNATAVREQNADSSDRDLSPGVPKLLERVLGRIARQNANRSARSSSGDDDEFRRDGHRSMAPRKRFGADGTTGLLPRSTTGEGPRSGLAALASWAGTDTLPGARAPFLQHGAVRRTSPVAASDDIRSVLARAARNEGLDLDEVTS